MSATQSFNAGLSATLSIPLSRKLVKQCHEAAAQQIAMQTQLVSNKRLDFELARLKNCGELKKAGIIFHPASPYHSVCADVVVTAPGGTLVPHEHQLPKPNWVNPSSSSEVVDPSSLDTSQSASPVNSDGVPLSSQEVSELSQSPSSQQASQLSGAAQLGVWQIGRMQSQP